jgi:hypothetical protein
MDVSSVLSPKSSEGRTMSFLGLEGALVVDLVVGVCLCKQRS